MAFCLEGGIESTWSYHQLCAQKSVLAVLRGPYSTWDRNGVSCVQAMCLKSCTLSSSCKVIILTFILSLLIGCKIGGNAKEHIVISGSPPGGRVRVGKKLEHWYLNLWWHLLVSVSPVIEWWRCIWTAKSQRITTGKNERTNMGYLVEESVSETEKGLPGRNLSSQERKIRQDHPHSKSHHPHCRVWEGDGEGKEGGSPTSSPIQSLRDWGVLLLSLAPPSAEFNESKKNYEVP